MPQPQPDILCIGECMVEMAPQPGGLYAMGFAGDTFNTAWHLRRQLSSEGRVSYFSAVGQDTLSDQMLAFMGEAGIDTAQVQRRADRTVGLYLIELTQGERSFSYWRDRSAARLLAEDKAALAAALAGRDLVYLSGITLAILEPEARARLLAALSAARTAGTRVAFDPNLRPRLWPSRQAMCAAVTEMAALSDILLPSFDDEASAFGDATPEATLDRYAAAGCLVVKNGAAEVLARAGGSQVRVRPPQVAELVDSTGAGDSFNAGFLAAWLDGQDLAASVAAGALLASRVVQGRGALVAG
jgi:2-dehydro-3-deoxygluconokinase